MSSPPTEGNLYDPPAPPAPERRPVSRPTFAEINLDRLTGNYRAIERAVGGAGMLPILKANAYGHGLVEVALHLEKSGPAALGVAFLEEGAQLREAGVKCPILVMGGIDADQIPEFLELNLTLTASSDAKLREIDRVAGRRGVRAKVHLKVDTGMGRIGMRPETASAMFETGLRAENVEVEAVYSHLACADEADRDFTRRQIERFREAVSFYPDRGLPSPRLHLANSAGILMYPESHLDLVRPGILLYGVYPSRLAERTIPVQPALSWKSRVVFFKVQRAGEPVSYGATWRPETDTRLITVPVGYGDGYLRSLSGRAEVIVGGELKPVVGRVCMDQLMADIGPEASAYNGDEVVLLGEQGPSSIGALDLAERAGAIPHELLSNINVRVSRRYTGG